MTPRWYIGWRYTLRALIPSMFRNDTVPVHVTSLMEWSLEAQGQIPGSLVCTLKALHRPPTNPLRFPQHLYYQTKYYTSCICKVSFIIVQHFMHKASMMNVQAEANAHSSIGLLAFCQTNKPRPTYAVNKVSACSTAGQLWKRLSKNTHFRVEFPQSLQESIQFFFL